MSKFFYAFCVILVLDILTSWATEFKPVSYWLFIASQTAFCGMWFCLERSENLIKTQQEIIGCLHNQLKNQ